MQMPDTSGLSQFPATWDEEANDRELLREGIVGAIRV